MKCDQCGSEYAGMCLICFEKILTEMKVRNREFMDLVARGATREEADAIICERMRFGKLAAC